MSLSNRIRQIQAKLPPVPARPAAGPPLDLSALDDQERRWIGAAKKIVDERGLSGLPLRDLRELERLLCKASGQEAPAEESFYLGHAADCACINCRSRAAYEAWHAAQEQLAPSAVMALLAAK